VGCLRSLGCLTALVMLAAVAYLTRDTWRGLLPSRSESGAGWAPLTVRGAATAKHAIESLAAPKGPSYVDVSGADFASYALHGVAPDSAQAAVIGDRLHVRGVYRSEPVEVIGTIDVPRSSVGVFRATEIDIRGVPVPGAVIARIFHGADSATVGLPAAVGDIRVARGHITLYKKTP
jgi:hypothetical protein